MKMQDGKRKRSTKIGEMHTKVNSKIHSKPHKHPQVAQESSSESDTSSDYDEICSFDSDINLSGTSLIIILIFINIVIQKFVAP